MAFGVNGLAIAAAFSNPTPFVLALQIGGLMLLALALSFGSERLLPYNKSWNSPQGDFWRDLMHFSFNEAMSLIPLLIIPIFVVAAPTPASSIWPGELPPLLQLLLCLLIFDLMNNLLHWLSHHWQPLWKLHSIHHQVKRMYGFNGIMKHPLYQIVASIVATGPLILLGMPKVFSLLLVFMSFTQLLLQHANTDYLLGPLRNIFAVAEVHRFHHLRGVAGNVNYALFFSFYDHLFSNHYYDDRNLQSEDIGLDYENYPQDWWGQIKAPFQTFDMLHGPIGNAEIESNRDFPDNAITEGRS